MLPTINGKEIIDCKIEDFYDILNKSEYRESSYIDYKSFFSVDKSHSSQERNSAISDLCDDFCSFANSYGGYIIYGIKENGGVPTEINGIDIKYNDTEKFERNIKDYLQRISPRRPNYRLHILETDEHKYIVVILIRHDSFAPYIHCPDEKNYHIVRRLNNSNILISYMELKNMFIQSRSMEKEIKELRQNRIRYYQELRSDRLKKTCRYMLLHLIPDTFLDSYYNKFMYDLERKGAKFSAMFNHVECNSQYIPMIEGLRYPGRGNEAECRIFNNGIAEVFYPIEKYIRDRKSEFDISFIALDELWDMLYYTIYDYIKKMKTIIETDRIIVCFSFIGLIGVSTEYDSWTDTESKIDQYEMLFTPFVFENILDNDLVDKDLKRMYIEFMLSFGIRNNSTLQAIYKEMYGQ